jgi:hypothetical protein
VFFRLFNFFVDLCLLRRAPQDLPASSSLFASTLLLSVITGAIGVSDVLPSAQALLASVTDAVIVILLIRLALQLKGFQPRFLQTATAVFGIGIILGLMAMPLQLSISEESMQGEMGGLIALAYLLLLGWVQVAIGHILRHALSVSLPLGIGLALTYSLISGTVIQTLFLQSSS